MVESRLICTFGCIRMISDNATNLVQSNALKELCSFYGIETSKGAPYSSKSRGLIENKNKPIVKNMLILAETFDIPWPTAVYLSALSYNTYVSKSTGFSPFELMFGRKHKHGLPTLLPDTVTANPKQYLEESTKMWELARKLAHQHDLETKSTRAAESGGKAKFDVEIGDFVLQKRHYVPKGVPKKHLPSQQEIPLRVVHVLDRVLIVEDYLGATAQTHVDNVIKLKPQDQAIWENMSVPLRARLGGFTSLELEKHFQDKSIPIGFTNDTPVEEKGTRAKTKIAKDNQEPGIQNTPSIDSSSASSEPEKEVTFAEDL